MDHQLGAASVQTVDYGGQALYDLLEPVVGLLDTFLSLLTWTNVFL